jgi:hypothetical protein
MNRDLHVIRITFNNDLYEAFIESYTLRDLFIFPAYSPMRGTPITLTSAPWPVREIIEREMGLSDSDSEFNL